MVFARYLVRSKPTPTSFWPLQEPCIRCHDRCSAPSRCRSPSAGFEEFHCLISFDRAEASAHVAIFSLRLRDPSRSTLKHHFAFERAKPAKMVKDELARRALGVDRLTAEVEHVTARPPMSRVRPRPMLDRP